MTFDIVRAPALTGIRHGFLGRGGGLSTGIFSGLNCGLGSDDDRPTVVENRRRALSAVAPGAALATPYQVHGAVAVIAEAWPAADRPRADALVTDRADLALGIVTADCVPVLFADVDARVVGAAHAGWKGAVGGVVEATVAAMVSIGAVRERIVAAIGPCIAQDSYEVDAAFKARFDDRSWFVPGRTGHWQFDLAGYVGNRLARAGVRHEALHLDTYTLPDRYYSFRRATHHGERDYGRQLSLIAL